MSSRSSEGTPTPRPALPPPQVLLEELTATERVTDASSTVPRRPQNTELTTKIMKFRNWNRNWGPRGHHGGAASETNSHGPQETARPYLTSRLWPSPENRVSAAWPALLMSTLPGHRWQERQSQTPTLCPLLLRAAWLHVSCLREHRHCRKLQAVLPGEVNRAEAPRLPGRTLRETHGPPPQAFFL